MIEEDLEAVHQMECLCFSSPWPRDSFQVAISQPSVLAAVAKKDGLLVGYVVAGCQGSELLIANLAVDPSARRQGIGRTLLNTALRFGRVWGVSVAILDVRESNASAIRMYKASGFKTVGRRPDYYSSPPEDSIVMARSLRN